MTPHEKARVGTLSRLAGTGEMERQMHYTTTNMSAATIAELRGLRHRLHAEILRTRRMETGLPDLPPEVRHDLVTYDLVAGKLAGTILTALGGY